ncbi:MAG TPA: type II secretion system protein [Candidatus Polarisedimenticolaceae bacterium]|nr:type II secretion system protein [Candidatus Polarisedimenticolaceae bacterium]
MNAWRRGERGHLMAGLVAGIAIMIIFTTLAAQAWLEVVRRDNEAEMIFRAQEIVRAIQRYRRDHGGLAPEKLEQLMEPGPRGQYYLRHLYKDPLVPGGKWGLLYVGPGGAILDPSAMAEEGDQAGIGGGIGGLLNPPPSPEGQPPNEGGGVQPMKPLQSAFGGSGEQAGLRIAGVKSLSKDSPFRYYKGLSDYSEWLFTYLDLESMMPGGRPNPDFPLVNPPNRSPGSMQPPQSPPQTSPPN